IPVDSQMQSHEAAVYSTELAMAQAVPESIEATRAEISQFYQTDITLASLRDTATVGPAQIPAPLLAASQFPSIGHTASTPLTYLDLALEAGLPIVLYIDPINPQAGEAEIWHPPMQAPVDPAIRAQFPGLAAGYTINCVVADGWG